MQLSYEKAPLIGKVGMKAGTFEPCKILSKLAEEEIPVGYPVEAGTDAARQVVKLTDAAAFIGVSVAPQGMVQDENVLAGAAVAAGVEVAPAVGGKFSAGAGAGAVRAFAVEAAAADGDLLLIELTGLQGE